MKDIWSEASQSCCKLLQDMFELTISIEFGSTLLSPIEHVNHADDVVQCFM